MNFKELANQQAVINLVGKDISLEFQYAASNLLNYETVLPKKINGEYYDFEVSVFYESSEYFSIYETMEDICYKRQVFELKVKTRKHTKTLYHKKYINPNK